MFLETSAYKTALRWVGGLFRGLSSWARPSYGSERLGCRGVLGIGVLRNGRPWRPCRAGEGKAADRLTPDRTAMSAKRGCGLGRGGVAGRATAASPSNGSEWTGSSRLGCRGVDWRGLQRTGSPWLPCRGADRKVTPGPDSRVVRGKGSEEKAMPGSGCRVVERMGSEGIASERRDCRVVERIGTERIATPDLGGHERAPPRSGSERIGWPELPWRVPDGLARGRSGLPCLPCRGSECVAPGNPALSEISHSIRWKRPQPSADVFSGRPSQMPTPQPA